MSVLPPSPLSYTGEVATPYITKPFPPTSSNNKFSVPTIWVDTEDSEVYILARNEYIAGVRTAEWVKVGDISGTVEGIIVDANSAPGTSPVLPVISSGVDVITITGAQVAAGTTTNVIRTNSLAANTLTIQVQRSTATASTTVGSNGVCHFNSAHFSVDSNGFVGLIGGTLAVDSIGVQANTAPGTNPVLPTGAGLLNINGATVAAQSIPLQSRSIAANSLQLEVQRAAATAATDTTSQGVASFNSSHFSVDANGFVALAGGGLAIDSIIPDTGTSPVVPTGAGAISVLGQATPSTSGIRITGGTNALNIAMFSPFVGDFSFLNNTGGQTEKILVSNTVDAASSAAQIVASVAGATSGDPQSIWSTTVTSWSAGVDNSDSDKWKLSLGTALGTNDMMTFSAAANGAIYLIPNGSGQVFIGDPGLGNPSPGTLLQLITSEPGGNTNLSVRNMSDTAASEASVSVVSNTATGANCEANFVVQILNPSTYSWTMGMNTTTGTQLDFTNNVDALTLSLKDAGAVTMPRQPAFFGYLATTATNKTGNGASYTLGADALTIVYGGADHGSAFTTAGVFTAPVTGIYDLRAQITLTGTTIATSFVISIVTTTRTYISTFTRAAASTDQTVTVSALASMTATNTATVTIVASGEAADTDDILGAATAQTYFCGALIC